MEITGSGNTTPSVYGITTQAAGSTVNIYKNKINTLSETGNFTTALPAVYGISIANGTTGNIYNNFVADLTATNISDADAIRGISQLHVRFALGRRIPIKADTDIIVSRGARREDRPLRADWRQARSF